VPDTVDIGIGLTLLVSILILAVLGYSWRYFDEPPEHHRGSFPLLLLFEAGMCGFALTGELGMAQIGSRLAAHRPDALLVTAFVLVVVSMPVKAAIVPFHFWLPDAHAVFAGRHGIPADAFEYTMVAVGAVTGVVGAVTCWQQRHLNGPRRIPRECTERRRRGGFRGSRSAVDLARCPARPAVGRPRRRHGLRSGLAPFAGAAEPAGPGRAPLGRTSAPSAFGVARRLRDVADGRPGSPAGRRRQPTLRERATVLSRTAWPGRSLLHLRPPVRPRTA
jgi:Proton-conducting membrane transporter